jgi:hypothetical protein
MSHKKFCIGHQILAAEPAGMRRNLLTDYMALKGLREVFQVALNGLDHCRV